MPINNKNSKKNRKFSTSKTTLSAQHKEKINELKNLKLNLPILKERLDSLQKEKEELQSRNNGFGFFDEKIGKNIYNINNEIIDIKNQIKNINNNSYKNKYYKNVAPIIYNYYDNIKKVSKRHTSSELSLKKSNRADLLNSYTKIVNPSKYNPIQKFSKISIDICKICKIEMNLVQSEGFVVCPQCGREELILIDSDKPSYKDPPPEAGEFTYKRINRFDEWLTQYQAKETTEIPQEVLDSILIEMKKEGITNLCKLTMTRVRKYLKKLGLNKYYEHIPHIIYCLNGLPTPRLSIETEEKLRSMFRQIQEIFDEVCPNNRKNFLSYSYLLRKLLELLGEDEHKKYFRLHKSREKIYHHDKVWQKICKKLNWQYIRTV